MAEGGADRDEGALTDLDDALVLAVREALDEQDGARARALAASLHAADQADLIELLPKDRRAPLLAVLGESFDIEALAHLDDDVREELITKLDPKTAGEALAELDDDDAVEILADLDEVDREKILRALPQPDRALLERSLSYPEYSAGRLMQRELVAVPDYWIVGQVIDYLRSHPDLPDEFYDIFIVDQTFRVVGSAPVSRILRSSRATPIAELHLETLRSIPAETDQEEVAYLFKQYGLTSAPVVDDDERLLGVLTIDDVVDVIQEESDDDILKLGGVQEGDTFASPWRTVLNRFPWLLVNLATAIAASLVIALFDKAIEQAVALAVLMPIVASMGGNAGGQTLTVTIRAIALKELTPANALRVVGKELLVGTLNGLAFFALGVVLALVWFQNPTLAAIFGLAMIINLACAALAGALIPLAIDRLGLDPAVSSGVFLTTVTDVVGFFAFLGLAVMFLL